MRRLAWTFAARIGDKYQIRLARPNSTVISMISDQHNRIPHPALNTKREKNTNNQAGIKKTSTNGSQEVSDGQWLTEADEQWQLE